MGQLEPSKPFFVTASGRAWRGQQAWQTLKRLANRAGVRAQDAQDADNRSEVTPHTLRRTFATRALAEGRNILAISKWLDHASVATTQASYADFTDAMLRREML